MPEMLYIEPVDANTGIAWWDENRRQVNVIIEAFHDWQQLHKFERDAGLWILAQIKSLKARSGDRSFSEWQIEIFDQIEAHIKANLPEES